MRFSYFILSFLKIGTVEEKKYMLELAIFFPQNRRLIDKLLTKKRVSTWVSLQYKAILDALRCDDPNVVKKEKSQR